jgi:hypothetical protein
MINTKNEKWNQWLAGITDGDGCFYINKKEKSVSFEVTTHTTDVRVLYNIKNMLKTGTVQLRSNSQSVRYRVKQQAAILDIVNRLNGKLHNQARLEQFKKVCELLKVQQIPSPSWLQKENAYLSGLIDSDGSVSISVSNSSAEDSQISGVAGRTIRLINSKAHNQISLKVTSIDRNYLDLVQNSYGLGTIYVEKPNKKNRSPNPKNHWTIRSYQDFQQVYEYLKLSPLKSVKMHRIRLALLYFKYKDLGYHLKAPGTIEAKIWTKFCKSWFKYSY